MKVFQAFYIIEGVKPYTNGETLEKLIDTVHYIHNKTTINEKLFTGELHTAYIWYVNRQRIWHYAINSLLYHIKEINILKCMMNS